MISTTEIPSWEPTYHNHPFKATFEDDFPFLFRWDILEGKFGMRLASFIPCQAAGVLDHKEPRGESPPVDVRF